MGGDWQGAAQELAASSCGTMGCRVRAAGHRNVNVTAPWARKQLENYGKHAMQQACGAGSSSRGRPDHSVPCTRTLAARIGACRLCKHRLLIVGLCRHAGPAGASTGRAVGGAQGGRGTTGEWRRGLPKRCSRPDAPCRSHVGRKVLDGYPLALRVQQQQVFDDRYGGVDNFRHPGTFGCLQTLKDPLGRAGTTAELGDRWKSTEGGPGRAGGFCKLLRTGVDRWQELETTRWRPRRPCCVRHACTACTSCSQALLAVLAASASTRSADQTPGTRARSLASSCALERRAIVAADRTELQVAFSRGSRPAGCRRQGASPSTCASGMSSWRRGG